MNNATVIKVISVGLLVAQLGCAPSSGTFFVKGIRAAPVTCRGESMESAVGGSLDLGTDPQYFVQFAVDGFLSSPAVSAGPTSLQLEQANRERLEVRKILLSYSLLTPGARTAKALRSDEVPVTLSLGPSSFAGVLTSNIIGPRGAEDLLAAISEATVSPVPADEVARLSVTIDIEARTTGTGSIVRTGAVTYPIQVYRSKDCANGFKVKTDEPCKYAGQDRPTRTVDLVIDCL